MGLTNMGPGGYAFAGDEGAPPAGGHVNYIAIGWDIWDNSETGNTFDPEGDIAWRSASFAGGGNHSAHVEIDELIMAPDGTVVSNHQPVGRDPDHVDGIGQSALSGPTQGSLATNVNRGIRLPYMIDDATHDPNRGSNDVVSIDDAVGDLWGPTGILMPVMKWTVTFESGFITVRLDERVEFDGVTYAPILYDPNPGPNYELPWNNRSDEERLVIVTATDALQDEAAVPDARAILGFFASTGGSNARQEVDNIKVTAYDEPRPFEETEEYIELAVGESWAINAGGPAVTDTAYGDVEADQHYGALVVDTVTDPEKILLRTKKWGYTGGSAADTTAAIGGLPDPTLESVYQSERWHGDDLQYTFEVVNNGRYQVDLLFAENSGGAVNAVGQSTRIFDVGLEGETVLSYWSPGEAAGNGKVITQGVAQLNAAVRRTYEVDVTDDVLNVVINDLGGSNPPENVEINGIVLTYLGAATGDPATGDVEDMTITDSRLADLGRVAPLGDFENHIDLGPPAIGDAALAAEVDFSGGEYTIRAAGGDLWDNWDRGHFIYRKVSGDYGIEADVAWVDPGPNDWSKLGLMVRESLNGDAATVLVQTRGGNNLPDGELTAHQRRLSTGGGTSIAAGGDTGIAFGNRAQRLRLVRVGNMFQAALDRGAGFEPLGMTALSAPDEMYWGLALTSHDDGYRAEGRFANVTELSAEDVRAAFVSGLPTLPAPIAIGIENKVGEVNQGSGERGFIAMLQEGAGGTSANMLTAEALLDFFPITSMETVPVINFEHNGVSTGDVGGDVDFPGLSANDDISLRAEGYLAVEDIDEPITLVVNSDDGFVLRIGHQTVGSYTGGRGAGSFQDVMPLVFPAPGLYPIQLEWTTGDGGASIELVQVDPQLDAIVVLVNDDGTNPDVLTVYADGPAVDLPTVNVVSIPASDRVDGVASDSGFEVRVVGATDSMNDQTTALALLCGDLASDGRGGFAVVDVIDLADLGNTPEGGGMFVGDDIEYPGMDPNVDEDDFAVLVEGWLELPAGDTVVNVNSDDGFRLWIGRIPVSSFEQGRGPDNSARIVRVAEAGLYAFRLVHHEGGGGAEIEFTDNLPENIGDPSFDAVRINDVDAFVKAWRTVRNAGEIVDPVNHLPPLCGTCSTGTAALSLVEIMSGLGGINALTGLADTFISPWGDTVPLTGFAFRTTEPVTLNSVTPTYTDTGTIPVATVIDEGDGAYTVSVNPPPAPATWLKLDLDVHGQDSGLDAILTVWVAHLPLDINQDGMVNVRDATAFGDEFRNARRPTLIDTNGDSAADVRDATEFGNQWNGRGQASQSWSNVALPEKP